MDLNVSLRTLAATQIGILDQIEKPVNPLINPVLQDPNEEEIEHLRFLRSISLKHESNTDLELEIGWRLC